MELKQAAEGISWQQFREAYLREGGDAFYSAWKVNYLEPALNGLEFLRHNIKYRPGLCPAAEEIQPRLIQLKTNYQHIEYAKEQALALERTIERIDSGRM